MKDLSEEEVNLYDRQIRLWGLEAQKRISQSKVAIVGLDAVAMEVAKNLAAAGVNLLLVDERKWADVKEEAALIVPPPIGGNFQDTQTLAEVYISCLREMNSHIKLEICTLSELVEARNISAMTATVDLKDRILPSLRDRSHSLLTAYTVVTDDFLFFICSQKNSDTSRKHALDEVLEIGHTEIFHKKPRAIDALSACLRKGPTSGGQRPVGFAEAAIVGGLISQQIRKAVSGNDVPDEWNLACFDRLVNSVTVASYPDSHRHIRSSGHEQHAEHLLIQTD